jgi:hypothetical protein
MDCRRAEELFSDDLEGTLHPLLKAELGDHIRSCPSCASLRESFALVVVALREGSVSVDAPAGLAERAATAALAAGRAVARRVPAPMPRWLQAVAAAAAIVITGGTMWVAIKGEPGRFVMRARDRVVATGVQLLEQRDRLAEDLRLMRIVVGTAFEARVDRVNDRVDDYRRLLEKRRSEGAKKDGQEAAPKTRPSAESRSFPNSRRVACVTDCERPCQSGTWRKRTLENSRSV